MQKTPITATCDPHLLATDFVAVWAKHPTAKGKTSALADHLRAEEKALALAAHLLLREEGKALALAGLWAVGKKQVMVIHAASGCRCPRPAAQCAEEQAYALDSIR